VKTSTAGSRRAAQARRPERQACIIFPDCHPEILVGLSCRLDPVISSCIAFDGIFGFEAVVSYRIGEGVKSHIRDRHGFKVSGFLRASVLQSV
jgi:hypothetical protein